MKKKNDLIQNLAKEFETDPKTITKHLKKIEVDNNLDEEYDYLVKLFAKHLFSKQKGVISSILVNKLSETVGQYNILLQFTKRTKFKQQQALNNLADLPDYIKEEYSNSAEKILSWIKYSFITEETSKIVADIQPGATIENHPIDLRATFYEKNRPEDLNLIFKREPSSLKSLSWDELTEHLSCLKRISPEFEPILNSASDFLENLTDFLAKNDNPKLVKKFFKRITASPSYYEILIEPEILIVDFSDIKLPSTLEVDYKSDENILYLNFDNQFSLKCSFEREEKESIFTVKFNDIPSDLELISV